MVWVIPVFAQMFLEMSGGKVGLPGPTQIVISVSNFFQSYWYMMFGAMVGAVIAIKRYYATVNGRVVIDRLLLKMPIVGDLIRKGVRREVYPHTGNLDHQRCTVAGGVTSVPRRQAIK